MATRNQIIRLASRIEALAAATNGARPAYVSEEYRTSPRKRHS